MADNICRMPFAAEVNTLETEVGCDQAFIARRHVENRTVVADSAKNTRSCSLFGPGRL